MQGHETPQFNIKSGSDSQLFFSREYTVSDKISQDPKYKKIVGLVKNGYVKNVDDDTAYETYNYPQLTRRTGHSIKGTTETIESQELRKGRTKSAPRKGNSSSDGSLDIELSPETYDDIFEATFRNSWREWTSDLNSEILLDYDKTAFGDAAAGEHLNKFISNGTAADSGLGTPKYLVGLKAVNPIVEFETKEEMDKYEIHELTCGERDIKYSALAQYGGVEGQDLYQEFQHLAVNTMSLSVSPGQIVTGSFGFMGANNPDLLGVKDFDKWEVIPDQNTFTEYKNAGRPIYEKTTTGEGVDKKDSYELFTGTTWTGTKILLVAPEGDIVNALAQTEKKAGRIFEKIDSDNIVCKDPLAVKNVIDGLADKVTTTTDQFTAREGFLYINGHRVQYGSNLTVEMNQNLKQLFAIFEKGSIATTPGILDITGTLDAYLINGYTEELHNMYSQDKDVEIIFCFQDSETNPEYLYVVQIPRAKFNSADFSTGSEEITESLPFTSVGERACRIFRIRRRLVEMYFENGKSEPLRINIESGTKEANYKVKLVKSDGTPITLSKLASNEAGVMKYSCSEVTGTPAVTAIVEYTENGKTFVRRNTWSI